MNRVREWKPGDVAMVTLDGEEWHIGLRCGVPSNLGWEYVKGDGKRWTNLVYKARPLIVIDPDDMLAVERLQDLYLAAEAKGLSGLSMLAALREFADPKPRIEEPTGLGAVVEDADGDKWVRTDKGVTVWSNGRYGDSMDIDFGRVRLRPWSDIDVVRVLAEGVAADA